MHCTCEFVVWWWNEERLDKRYIGWGAFMVFNAIFNIFSAMSWRSVFLVEEAGVPWASQRPVASYWQTWLHTIVSSTPRYERDSNSLRYVYCYRVIIISNPEAWMSYVIIFLRINHYSVDIKKTFNGHQFDTFK